MPSIAATEKAESVLSFFYGCAGDWAYYVEPSPDWVEGYTLRAFVAYRRHLFTGKRRVLSDGETQYEAERAVYESQRQVRHSLYYKQVRRKFPVR